MYCAGQIEFGGPPGHVEADQTARRQRSHPPFHRVDRNLRAVVAAYPASRVEKPETDEQTVQGTERSGSRLAI